MPYIVSEQLKQRLPSAKFGIIRYRHIDIGDSPQMLKGRLELFQESIYIELQEKPIADIPELAEWRRTFKQIGTDPSRYRPSSESLYRRIQKKNFLPSIHSAVDVNNFFSLYYKIPLGIYDLDRIEGTVTITIGTEQDEYIALNGRSVNFADKLVSKDERGPFGSPIVDSERTAVTRETKNALQIVYFLPSMSEDAARRQLQAIQTMFVQIHGGEADAQLLS
ncbi:phenylalanine--tRNA ligase beta subunit-related protein [Anoxybacillus geothermalis]|uniref:B3/B4 domain-containing protein n=1 Tax=Geobacillus TaxID=129337 RepID=UPI000C291FED|nr:MULTISPECIES: phenylalanine--tRNA ligase beta subunit-related protein [Geobacillus]MED0655301.1 phenylalanine--tRNA ligase beta subunit-related protein [Anoxybacillus geothermalis]MCK7605366.1 phenylalanine--tRNA ligase beta subunit-related protein [Geobacillus stearothermophilus]MDF9297828.1 phenylalanine--tRNA ligase beta subunit-related protein [Geobacillus stearothermophilus]MED3667282.1 phenylalanine--tRNA ligase beta subunit-related protein [Geobacillus kaustophilus]MED5073606.1 pheny